MRQACPALDTLRVGDVVIARTFQVSPTDLVSHREATFTQAAFDPAQALSSLARAGAFTVCRGQACPGELVVDRAVEALLGALRASPGDSSEVIVRNVGALRSFATAVLGEPIATAATVRYRSRRHPGATHLTIAVELRRRSGDRLASFDLGLEIARLVDTADAMSLDAA